MSSPVRAPSYRAVLRVPGALRCSSSALLGRLSSGVVFLALVLAVADATGSYASAGAAMALFGLAVAVLSPPRAALIDRFGLRRALVPMAAVYALCLACLAVATWTPGTGPGPLAALAMAAGACAPPLGPVMRTLWSHMVADRELLQRAYSLDTVAEELVLLAGPLVLGALLVVAPPALGLAVAAALALSGTVLLAFSPPARTLPTSAGRAPAATAGDAPAPRTPHRRPFGALLAPVALSAATGLALGAVALLNVAFAEQHGGAALAVWAETAQAAGSVMGGLAYGMAAWRARPRVRLLLLGAALGAGTAAAAAAPGMVALCAVLLVVGTCTAPLLTTAYLVADEAVEADRRTRAGTWVNTAFNAGSSAGGAAAGALVAWTSPAAVYPVAAAPLLAVAALLAVVSPSGRGGWPAGRRRGPTRPVPRRRPGSEGSPRSGPPAAPS